MKGAAAAEATLRAKGWKASLTPADVTEAGGTTGGLMTAVAARHGLGRAHGCNTATVSKARGAVHTFSGVCGRGVALGNVYLETGGVMSRTSWDVLCAVGRRLAQLRWPFVVGGDWNLEPGVLQSSGWLDMIGGAVLAPLGGTCLPAESTLDY